MCHVRERGVVFSVAKIFRFKRTHHKFILIGFLKFQTNFFFFFLQKTKMKSTFDSVFTFLFVEKGRAEILFDFKKKKNELIN